MRYNKYGNKRTVIDGIKFASKKEAAYYQELKLREKAGDIMGFKCQPIFELQPKFKHEGKTIRSITYIADFLVYHDGFNEVVDVKGVQTAVFKIKWKMLLWKFGPKSDQSYREYRFTII